MGKILGIDYGEKNVGIAISDMSKTMAFGRDVYSNKNHELLLKRIKEICLKEDVRGIVIGYPLSLDGKENCQTDNVRQFGSKLHELTNCSVEYVDERLTSKQLKKSLTFYGEMLKNKKVEKNKIEAQTILQMHLDTKNKQI